MKNLLQRRYMAAVLGMIIMFMMAALRINLSIAMVAMVNDTTLNMPKNNSDEVNECPPHEFYNSTRTVLSRGEFFWSPEVQGHIQSAGYWGLLIFQIPGGIIAKKFGAKKTIIYGQLVAGFSNLLSPIAARSHPYLFFVLTFLRGMAQAVQPPSVSILSAKWFPRNERGFLGATIYCGLSAGALLTGLICGLLCDSEFLDGWPLVFYTFGLLSVVVALLFYFIYFETPEEDPWISKAELDHIQKHVDTKSDNENLPTPWLKIFTSLHTHMLVLAIFGQLWLFFYFLSVHPIYLGTILHYPIKENGALSGIPFIAAIIAGWATCYFSYWVTNQKKLGVSVLRKLMNSLSTLIFVIGMIGIYFSKCDLLMNEIFLYIAISSNGFTPGGALISPPDISPTFCGPLMGYASSMANLSGVVATVMVGYLTNEEQNLTQWGKIFLISAAVPLVTGLLYQFFGSAEIQPWDPAFKEPKKEQKSKENGPTLKESTRF